MIFKKSFSRRLTFYVLLIVSVLFVIAISIVSASSHKMLKDEAIRLSNSKLESTIQSIQNVMGGIESTTAALQWNVWDNRFDEDALYRITRECIKSNPNIVGCAIAFEPGYFKGKEDFSPYSCRTAEGGIDSFQLATDAYDYHLMDWYQIPKLLSSTYWTDPYFDEGGANVLMTTFSLPLADDTGKMYAILTADLNLQNLRQIVNSVKPFPHSITVMTATDGSFIVHPNQDYILRHTPFSVAMETGNESLRQFGMQALHSHNGTIEREISDQRSFIVYSHLPNDWTIAVMCPLQDVLDKNKDMIAMVIIVTFFGLLVLFQACRYSIKQQTEPLLKFADYAKSIAAQDNECVLPEIHTRDEVWKLKEALSEMQVSLKEYSLKEAETQRIQSELHIATKIQMGMLPARFKESKDIDIDAYMHPAKEVGGDLYDYYMKDGKLFFCIGDVSGKGVPAAMIMAITINAFRYLSKLISEPERIMAEINDSLAAKNETNLFVTLFIGILDPHTGELSYCNGGHNPLVMLKKDGNCDFLKPKTNIAVGLFGDFQFEGEKMNIERGDNLFLYTDGVTEAESTDKSLYGEQRMLSVLTNAPRKPKYLISEITSDIDVYTSGADQSDDITMLAISYKD